MFIKGLQKLTLLDYPTKTACTIFTGGCNFRCPFCHNASLVVNVNEGEKYETEQVLSFLKKRQGLLDGVCVTGGEPLLQKDIKEFLGNIKDMGYSIKLDTNGYSPEKLMEIVSEGLCDYVAMDIKNCKEKYSVTAGIDIDISKIEKSVEFFPSPCYNRFDCGKHRKEGVFHERTDHAGRIQQRGIHSFAVSEDQGSY